MLPPTLTGLYRLFLRASSASVLHHTVATRNLRRLWRPTFESAAIVTKKLGSSQDVHERCQLEGWLNAWEKRMDGTLALLYNSARSRGLTHKVTRNLSFLFLGEYKRSQRVRSWQAQNKYPMDGKVVDAKKALRRKVEEELRERGKGVVREVVKLAEARDGITLGGGCADK